MQEQLVGLLGDRWVFSFPVAILTHFLPVRRFADDCSSYMKSECPRGHAFPESLRPGRSDCAVCHREDERRRRRAKGAKPWIAPTACPRGHPYPENKRPGRSDCAECHRINARARYSADPVAHREAALQYQRENRAASTARQRAWRHANAERMLEISRRRRLGYGKEAAAYAEVLRGDPCSYCGAPVTEIDHIRPVSDGGSSGWDNLTGACRSCNGSKSRFDLLTFLSRYPLGASREPAAAGAGGAV